MNIEYIRIKNFKSIRNVKIYFNDKFNVLIGENNVGKTTVLEAMLLWKKCYDVNIQQKKKKFYADSRNIRFEDLKFLRISDDIDLLNDKDESVEVEISFKDKGAIYNLGFEIAKVQKIRNAYFQVKYTQHEEFIKFEKLADSYNKNLNNFIMFFETRPIYSITSKEPYMNKSQILSKISKGKGHEVLRNKIIGNSTTKESRKNIEDTIYNITGEKFEFTERDQGNREYIKLMVKKDGQATDLLSQGSGFLQMTEIFSSIEYVDAKLSVLLIDEPDSHIHTKLQANLLNEFRLIKDSQLFLISHNERFMDNVNDNEIIFINKKDKENGVIEPLKQGYKKLVVENLVGDLETIEQLKYANKIVLVEGPGDKKFIEDLYSKYLLIDDQISKSQTHINVLGGIDILDVKLKIISKTYKELVDKDAKWILIRDTDFMPKTKKEECKSLITNNIHYQNKVCIFQDGYGVESTLFAEEEKLSSLISKYYTDVDKEVIDRIVGLLNAQYLSNINNVNTELYGIVEDAFISQCNRRKGDKILDKIKFRDFVKDIETDIQYIMNKTVIDKYLNNLNSEINSYIKSNKYKALNHKSIIKLYIENIKAIEDFYNSHLEILNESFGIDEIYEVDLDFLVDKNKYEDIIKVI